MTSLSIRKIFPVLAAAWLGACQSDAVSPDTSNPKFSASTALQETAESRLAKSDTALWHSIKETDGIIVVGLKAAGTKKGMVRGRANISQNEWKTAAREVMREKEADIVSADTLRIPSVTIKPASIDAIRRIRSLPNVEYVEPNLIKVMLFSGDGCNSGSSGGDSQFTDPSITLPSGDIVAATYGPTGMNVLNAWKLATGQGVTIGVTDTGLGGGNGEFVPATFSSGQSSGRSITVSQPGPATCSHGSRIAGLATAPMNGASTAGVAYKANLFSIWQADGSASPGGYVSAAVIDTAASVSSVVVLAWGFAPGVTEGSLHVDAVINYHHYVRDVVFIGAAGTCPIGSYCPQMESAVFPASKEEVLAVTAAGSDGTRPSNVYNYGAKSGVIAYTGLATVGIIPGILSMNGSSAATGFVAGAAALVRQRFPTLSARGVMDQLIKTSGSTCGAPHIWREALVNVAAAVGAPCINHFLGTLTITSSTAVEDYYALVRRTVVANAPPMGIGGSGSYNAQWTLRPEQIVTNTTEGSITDGFGNTYWQSRKSIKFRKAYDNLPYRTLVSMVANDPTLGTSDVREMSVLVCPSVTNCANTNRAFPGETPPPPVMSASISGADLVPPSSFCNYFAAASNGTEPYSYEWFVNSVSAGSSETLILSTSFSGSVSIALKATDSASHVAWAYKTVYVNSEATCYDMRPAKR